jgi:chemotaxis signal transduction protein
VVSGVIRADEQRMILVLDADQLAKELQ